MYRASLVQQGRGGLSDTQAGSLDPLDHRLLWIFLDPHLDPPPFPAPSLPPSVAGRDEGNTAWIAVSQ